MQRTCAPLTLLLGMSGLAAPSLGPSSFTSTEDAGEGIRAFRDKSSPAWKGR